MHVLSRTKFYLSFYAYFSKNRFLCKKIFSGASVLIVLTNNGKNKMHDLFTDCQYCNNNDNENTLSMPLIGDTAPQFTAQSTNGTINFPDDFAGKWIIFFSHPSDFTPICTTEFMAFQKHLDEFHNLNAEPVGLSIGTLTGHLAWLDAIGEIEDNDGKYTEITFPVIDDIQMHIAKMYGMIHPKTSSTKTVRAVFIIDPNGIIRAILYYPASNGRNMAEIMRLLIALQTTDDFKVSTPVDWEPGKPVVLPAPATAIGMRERKNNKKNDIDVRAWFLTFKNLDADTIFKKIHTPNKNN